MRFVVAEWFKASGAPSRTRAARSRCTGRCLRPAPLPFGGGLVRRSTATSTSGAPAAETRRTRRYRSSGSSVNPRRLRDRTIVPYSRASTLSGSITQSESIDPTCLKGLSGLWCSRRRRKGTQPPMRTIDSRYAWRAAATSRRVEYAASTFAGSCVAEVRGPCGTFPLRSRSSSSGPGDSPPEREPPDSPWTTEPWIYVFYRISTPVTSTKITFEIPQELREAMDKHPEVNWSAVFREALVRHARVLDLAKQILEDEEDVRIARMTERLRRGAGDRFRKAAHARRG